MKFKIFKKKPKGLRNPVWHRRVLKWFLIRDAEFLYSIFTSWVHFVGAFVLLYFAFRYQFFTDRQDSNTLLWMGIATKYGYVLLALLTAGTNMTKRSRYFRRIVKLQGPKLTAS